MPTSTFFRKLFYVCLAIASKSQIVTLFGTFHHIPKPIAEAILRQMNEMSVLYFKPDRSTAYDLSLNITPIRRDPSLDSQNIFNDQMGSHGRPTPSHSAPSQIISDDNTETDDEITDDIRRSSMALSSTPMGAKRKRLI